MSRRKRTQSALIIAIGALVLAGSFAFSPNLRSDEQASQGKGESGETFVEFAVDGYSNNVQFVGDRRSTLNKQLVSAYKNRVVDDHPKKWEIWGRFRFINEEGKKVGGVLYGPVGTISVDREYSHIEFDEIAKTLGKQVDRAKEILGQ